MVNDKWFADIRVAVDGETQRVTQRLSDRAQTLQARYARSTARVGAVGV